MSARSEVETQISNLWKDGDVCRWVIKNLPLLEKAHSAPWCSVFNISLDYSLQSADSCSDNLSGFRQKRKLVMSGGFEGTRGHIEALNNIYEYKALACADDALVGLMLEPDSYIRELKGREPLVGIDLRTEMWATSGLVDFVIKLPRKPPSLPDQYFFQFIHEQIKPASWCVSIENRSWLEIITRGQVEKVIDAGRLFSHSPNIHSSFLASTRMKSVEEVRLALWDYSMMIASGSDFSDISTFIPIEQMARIIYEDFSKDL